MTTQETSRREESSNIQTQMPTEWAAFIHNVVSQLTQENVALTYELNNVKIAVPGSSNDRGASEKAQWIIDGSITVRGTKGSSQ